MPNPSRLDLRVMCGPMRCGEPSIVGYYSVVFPACGLNKFCEFKGSFKSS